MERAPIYQSHLRSNKLFDQDNVRAAFYSASQPHSQQAMPAG
jgi:hypothetical protein